MAFFNSSTSNAAPAAAAEKDIEMSDPPTDSISSVWDNSVRIYEVGAGGQSQGKAMYQHEGPVLSVCWNKEGNKVFSGGADNAGRMYDIATGQATQVAQHDAPIKVVKCWDKTIKYWDLTPPAPVATVVDVQYPLMVVGTAERHIQIFNLTNPTTPTRFAHTMLSPLKWQTRVVSCFTASSNSGFAVGSVEGRVAIHNNFSFKCHRRDSSPTQKDGAIVFAVNDISFHPVHGTFSTCGADGSIHFWDKDARNRLKSHSMPLRVRSPPPLFNRNGSIFAYADNPNKLMLHACKDDEVKKRPRKV
ncbi:WD40-repeat-containing domain protein [Mycena polygramma]|nr:WD40-repeat-containing domain protein [Mycena polygramma]